LLDVGWDYLQLASHVMRALATAIDGDPSHALWFVDEDDVSDEVPRSIKLRHRPGCQQRGMHTR
jgi:hypothetical protein